MAAKWLGTNVSVNEGNIVQQGIKAFGNWIKGQTGLGLTDAQVSQNEYQTEMANTQYQRGVEDMKAAGLNPALMYGSGAQPAPSPTGANVGTPNFSFQEAVNALTLPYQIEQMKANIVKTKEDTESVRVQRDKTLKEIENLRATYNEILARTDLTDTQQANLVVIGSYLEQMQQATLEKVRSEARLNNSTKKRIDELLPGEKELQNLSIQDFQKQWNKIDAEITQIANQTKLLKEDLTNYAVNRMHGPIADIFRAYLEGNRDKDNNGLADDRGE